MHKTRRSLLAQYTASFRLLLVATGRLDKQHLKEEDGVEDGGGGEANEQQVVVHLGQGGVESRPRPGHDEQEGKGAQLSRLTRSPYLEDLWETGQCGEGDGGALEKGHHVVTDVLRDQQAGRKDGVDCGDEQQLHHASSVEANEQDKKRILPRDEERLAIGDEGIAGTEVVGECDGCRDRLQQLRQKAESRDALAQQNLGDLRQFDHGGAANDADRQALAEDELDAVAVGDASFLENCPGAAWTNEGIQRVLCCLEGRLHLGREGIECTRVSAVDR